VRVRHRAGIFYGEMASVEFQGHSAAKCCEQSLV
jgi:hypothetical protein